MAYASAAAPPAAHRSRRACRSLPAALLLLLAASGAPASPLADQHFPLQPGSTWAYRGLLRTELGGRGVAEARVEVTKAVTARRELGPDSALVWLDQSLRLLRGDARSKGLADDIASLSSPYLYFLDGDKVYDIASGDLYDRIRDPRTAPAVTIGQLREAAAISGPDLVFPLHPGQRFGEAESLQRGDDSYQWIVKRAEPQKIAGKVYRDAYSLRFHTLPDVTELHFVPGIGVTREKYVHIGTVIEWDLRLVRFHLVRPGGKPPAALTTPALQHLLHHRNVGDTRDGAHTPRQAFCGELQHSLEATDSTDPSTARPPQAAPSG